MPAQNKHSSSCAKCRTANSLAYKLMKAQQIPQKSIHGLINSPTCKLINSLTQNLSNLSTYQPIDSKNHHLANSKKTLTRHLINLQTHHPTTFPTCKLITSSTQKPSNLSTYRLENSSPRQLKKTLTRHLINLKTHHLTTSST